MAKLKCPCGEKVKVKLEKEPFKLECKNKKCNNSGLVSKDNVMNFKVLKR